MSRHLCFLFKQIRAQETITLLREHLGCSGAVRSTLRKSTLTVTVVVPLQKELFCTVYILIFAFTIQYGPFRYQYGLEYKKPLHC